MRYETYSPEVRSLSETQRTISGMLHAYITSFICNKGDPNALAGRSAGRPKWEACVGGGEKPRTMIFGKNVLELVGGENHGEVAECVYDEWALEECHFWWDKVELTQQ